MKSVLLSLSFLLTVITPLVAGPPGPGTNHYEFDLTVDPAQASLKGHVVLTVDPAQYPEGRLYLRLLLNQETEKNPRVYGPLQDIEGVGGVGQTVSALTVGGKPTEVVYAPDPTPGFMAVNLAKTQVLVTLPAGGGPVEVAFDYQVNLHPNLVMDDFSSGPRFFSRFSWLPWASGSNDRDKESARPFTYQARIGFPDDWDLLKTGTSFRTEPSGHFTFASVVPVHSLPLLAVKDFGTYQTVVGGKTLTMHYEKDAESRARLLSTYAQDALEAYAQRYFPLEGAFVSIVQGTPGFFGMAADGVVILGNGLYRPADYLTPGLMDRLTEYVVAHELGHLYFGIGVGQDFLRDNYLSEGLNDTSTLLYLEKKYGRWDNLFLPTKDWVQKSLGSALADNLKQSFRIRKADTVLSTHQSGWDDALNNPSVREVNLNAKASTDYDRPTFVFSMLAATLGLSPESFADVLAEIAKAWYGKALDTNSLQSFLEERYHVALGPFFQTYVTAPGWIDYELSGTVNRQRENKTWSHELVVSDRQANRAFVPTILTLRYADGSVETHPVAATGPLTVETDLPIVWAALDFNVDALDFDRKNNFVPRQLLLNPDSDDRPLVDSHLDTLTPVSTFLMAPPDGTLVLGVGPALSDDLTYNSTVGTVLSYDPASRKVALGLATTALYQPTTSATWDLSALALANQRQSLFGGWSQTLYLPVDYGQSGRLQAPLLTLSTRGGGDFLSGVPQLGRFDQGVTWNNFNTSGSMVTVGHQGLYDVVTSKLGGRIEADWEQVFPFFPRAFLGAGLKAGGGWGHLTDEVARYSTGGQVFVGVPLLAGQGWITGNTFALQSLQAALIYRWSTDFETPQALGTSVVENTVILALLPSLLTIGDSPIQGLAVGLSLNVNALRSHPEKVSSWTPGFFFEATPFTSVFSQLSGW